MDLTGHIFAIGDLGGEKDNEETIRMRDLLKQLSTDGYIERGVVDNANDNVADNFEQIFNHYSKDTIRRIL